MKSGAITQAETQQCEVGKGENPIFRESNLKEKKKNKSRMIDSDGEKCTVMGVMVAQ